VFGRPTCLRKRASPGEGGHLGGPSHAIPRTGECCGLTSIEVDNISHKPSLWQIKNEPLPNQRAGALCHSRRRRMQPTGLLGELAELTGIPGTGTHSAGATHNNIR
jgi:hypothetical protein